MSETLTFRARNHRDVEVDATLWTKALAASEARPGGRLTPDDAAALFVIVAADGHYSPLEKRTLKHIRSHFPWTEAGNTKFRALVREAASRGWSPDEILTTSFKASNGRAVTVDARLWGEAQARTEAQGDGRLGIDDAIALLQLVMADGVYTDLEKRTVGHIRRQFRWTEQGDETFRETIRNAAARGWTPAEIDRTLQDSGPDEVPPRA